MTNDNTVIGAKRAMLIINPISGTSDKRHLAEQVTAIVEGIGYSLDVRLTERAGHATELAQEAVKLGYDAVIAAGGDGTVNETARGLRDTPVPLAIIPAGSGNGLARHLNIPVDVDEALKVFAKGRIIDADYGTVNNRPFFCTFGLGYDAAVSHNFAAKSSRGLMTYLMSCVEEVVKYNGETYTVSANGKILTDKALVVACANASQYGNNAYIAPEATMLDGLLDIVIIHQGTPIDTAIVGFDLVTGYLNKSTMYQTFRAPSAVIYRQNEGKAHIDGEPCFLEDILEVKCHPHSLRIFVAEPCKKVTPYITPTVSFWKELYMKISKKLAKKK